MVVVKMLLVIALIYIAIDDFLNFRIRNESVVAIIILILVKYFLSGLPIDYGFRIIFTFFVFACLLLSYWRGYLGGGDVKLLPLAFLWLEYSEWLLFYAILTIVTLLYAILALLKILPSDTSKGRPRMAYGPCISIAWILCIFLSQDIT